MFPLVLRGASMKIRWFIWTAGIAALAFLALMPLRVALGWSDLGRIGFAARQVGGTIWYGRIGDLHLRSQPVGTLDVALDPGALLFGSIDMRFERLDSPEGPLTGTLVAGGARGIRSTSGRIAVSDMFAPVPVAALELSDVTVLFRDGRCAEARGRISPLIAVPIPGLRFDSGMAGTLKCDGESAHVEMTSGSRAERIDFYVQQSGDYRIRMSIRSGDPTVRSALAVLGFRSSPEGVSLTVNGRL